MLGFFFAASHRCPRTYHFLCSGAAVTYAHRWCSWILKSPTPTLEYHYCMIITIKFSRRLWPFCRRVLLSRFTQVQIWLIQLSDWKRSGKCVSFWINSQFSNQKEAPGAHLHTFTVWFLKDGAMRCRMSWGTDWHHTSHPNCSVFTLHLPAALIVTWGDNSVVLHSIHIMCVYVCTVHLHNADLSRKNAGWQICQVALCATKSRKVTPRKSSVLRGILSDSPHFLWTVNFYFLQSLAFLSFLKIRFLLRKKTFDFITLA